MRARQEIDVASVAAIASANEILRGIVGSTVHGTAVEGQDDRDEMGVFIDPAENVCGLTPIDHYVYRDRPEGVRSGPGDLDLVLYSLRRFCGLAARGNPSVLLLLWLPSYITTTALGQRLIDIRSAFVSREGGKRFLGYLTAQRMSLTGERNKKVSRPELVAKYGFDTKYAMHALRLGFQGAEYLTTGNISLPVREPDLTTLRAVRNGEVSFAETLALITAAEDRLKGLIADCELAADRDRINRFMVEAHQEHWREP